MNTIRQVASHYQFKNILTLWPILFWSVIIMALAALDQWNTYVTTIDSARATASESVSKDLVYRRWATKHGGVYAPITPETPSNPNLADIPERDISTPSGRKLTLINPAYMTRQVHELEKEDFGSLGHITSLKPIRAENAPDEWEKRALLAFERGAKEESSIEPIGSETYFRFMRPLVTEKACLKCHEKQGYKVGDIRGGISVSLPWTRYRREVWIQLLAHLPMYGGIWIIGLLGLRYSRNQIQDHLSKRRRIEQELKVQKERLDLAVQGSTDGIWDWNIETGELYVSERWCELMGYRHDEAEVKIRQSTWAEWIHPDDLAGSLDDMHQHLKLRKPYASEYRARTRSGEYRWFLNRGQAIWNELGRAIRLIGSSTDITERKQLENEIVASKGVLEAALASMSDAVFITDGEGQLIHYNDAFATFHKFKTKEECTRKLAEFPQIFEAYSDRGALVPVAQWMLPRALRGETGISVEFTMKRRDTGETWVGSYNFAPIRGPDGVIVGAVVTARDITKIKEAENAVRELNADLETKVHQRTAELELANQTLAVAKDAAESANLAKSAFLANMSHEIRTPMNGILGMANILRREGVTRKQAERLDKINTSAQHLLHVINDILDISKIEAGKFFIEETHVLISSLIADVISTLFERANAKGIQLMVKAIDLPSNLYGDPTRIQQALFNYVTNAIKFTEKGTVTLRALKQEETAESVLIRFEVHDTGVGISAEALSRLFNTFEQADNSITRKYGGTGLGLAITRRLAELMGGEAGVESTPRVGSTFWFTARLKKGEAEETSRPAMSTDPEKAFRDLYQGSRVLVVDDEPMNREVAMIQLEAAGLAVDMAGDGEEAISMAQEFVYAAILMDMQMPNVDGLEATRQIRLLAGHRHTPIIAMTANAFAEDKARCLEAGMDDFLIKPFDADTLFATLLRSLSQREGQKRSADTA